jgi:hypothetical protein
MPGKFNPPTTCIKCGGAMEVGTYLGYRSIPRPGLQAENVGDTMKWWKLQDGHVLVKPQGDPLMVLHYRCTDCGYLESYAPGAV